MERAEYGKFLDFRATTAKYAWESFIQKRNNCIIPIHPSFTTHSEPLGKKQLETYHTYLTNSIDFDEFSYRAIIITEMRENPDIFIPAFRYCYIPVYYTPDLKRGVFTSISPFAVPEGQIISGRDSDTSETVVFRPTLVVEALERSLSEEEDFTDQIKHMFFLRDHTRAEPGFVHSDDVTYDAVFHKFQK